ncbi:hypothetical protein [Sporomusa aerivorans]|uniref:hypothetical protein n=1 Tax=Sporomusa aerivorans TaxID=204936 RepID=UPI00352A3734
MANTETLQKWFSSDMKEAILVLSGDYWLVYVETKESKLLGKSAEEAREILKELDKIENFPGF